MRILNATNLEITEVALFIVREYIVLLTSHKMFTMITAKPKKKAEYG